MSAKVYIKFDGSQPKVTPGVTKGPYAGWTEVASVSWSNSRQGIGGTGTGKLNVSDVTFTMPYGPAGMDLFSLATNGREIEEVLIEFVDFAQNPPFRFLQITMKKVVVTGYHVGGGEKPSVMVTLQPTSIEYNYSEATTDGKSAALLQFDLKSRGLA